MKRILLPALISLLVFIIIASLWQTINLYTKNNEIESKNLETNYQHAIKSLELESYISAKKELEKFKDGKYDTNKYKDAQALYFYANAKCEIFYFFSSYGDKIYISSSVDNVLHRIPDAYNGLFASRIHSFREEIRQHQKEYDNEISKRLNSQ